MKMREFPLLGLILAMFFGARTANRSESPAQVHNIVRTAESSRAPKRGASSAHAEKAAAAAGVNGCAETPAAVEAEKLPWWLTRDAHGCATVSPAWSQICKMNPKHPGSEDLLADKLTEEQFVALCLGDVGKVTSMMAAVPNPERTHLGLMTDRAIEAMQVAAAEANFLPLAHYLPWPAPGVGAAGASSAAEEQVEAESREPGVLVFRNVEKEAASKEKTREAEPAARGNYLLIFLIPEVPTEGLDREVFARAQKMMEKVSPGASTIYFAGPSFSGSVPSLRELDNGLEKACIHAVSGSVTNFAPYDQAKLDPKTKERVCTSTFKVMQMSDDQALCWFVSGARAFGYHSNQIAILSEEGTQYGRQEGPKDDEGPVVTSGSTPVALQCPKAGAEDEMVRLWFLHFPREISKLRNAYGAEAGKPAASEGAGQTGLGLQWQDSENPQHDDLQTYGERQTPLSQEAVLASLSITLRAQGIKALGVLATDPMDEAFLIHSIKESSPDVRLFVRDPDLLFLRTPDVGSLNGTLLVSNYPLIPQNQFWSAGKDPQDLSGARERRLISFPSAFQEGEYNAFVELVEDAKWSPAGEKLKRLEWEWPSGIKAQTDGKPDDPNKPKARPLWLAAIGTAGHYPIKVLNYSSYNDAQKAELKLHSLELGPPQLLPMAFWGILALLGLLHVLGIQMPSAVPSYFARDFDTSNRSSAITLVKLFCHMMGLLTIGLAQMVLGSSYLFFYGSGWRYEILAGAVAVMTVLLVTTAWTQFRKLSVLCRLQAKARIASNTIIPPAIIGPTIIRPKRIFFSAIASQVIMVGAGLFWAAMTVGNRFDNAFLHFRDLNLSSGVAPTLPLTAVLLVLYFGVWAYMRRLSYWEHRYVEMFQLRLDQVIQQDMGKNVTAIDACLLGPLENGKWLAGFWTVFGLSILAFRPWITLDMIDPSRVSMFALSFFGLALLTVWLNWFRFINIWIHLRSILEHLENLPIRAAFQRLPREKSLPILHWSSSQNTFLLRQVLDRLRALAREDANAQNVALLAQFEARIDALSKDKPVKMEIMERRVVGGSPWPNPQVPSRRREDHVREAREEMTRLSGTLSARLREEYWKRGSSATNDAQTKAPPAPGDVKHVLAEDIVALPFYAYIRKVISELRNILFFLGVAISLLFAALHTYAFRADQAIDWWFFGLFAFMGTGIVIVVAQMERNALLNRLSDGTPGELGASFYLQLLKYGAVPFVTIFGSQIPYVSNVVLKWVQPALEALH